MVGTMLSLELLLHMTVNPQEDVGLLCEVELTFVQNVITISDGFALGPQTCP